MSQLTDLRDQCLAMADNLAQLQKASSYSGPNESALSASEMALRSKVLVLNTELVTNALNASAEAQNQLKQAITAAQSVSGTINDVAQALKIAADLLTIAGGVASDNPSAVIGAASQTVTDVAALT